MTDFGEILGPVAVVIVFGWIMKLYLGYRQQIKISQLQADMQNRLMDKFGSSQEMMEYLGSEAGERFMKSATIERGSPYGKILGSIQSGVILTLAGVAALAFRAELGPGDEAALSFAFLGMLFLALGLGFLISSLAAYLLSKKWGVINGAGGRAGE